ncbi:hypothetical protein VTN96DRAFT_9881 [Rasamsonia emersonii]|uniref:Uncharacterized protein n=1 Tax=Rasamsonia emersonii (strain ATCC 16479 / CBS 393.64 / IMI 116815) TaxID=1408163 RepID=A0A0F4YMR5_RASE3|nr:hypothetical protein T310_6434 [Rasamsonia emersonii CBS 393.64]KKA19577.1 hypothetical protein T310_6434 [Rasamsonia emersonii CBS 393.64]
MPDGSSGGRLRKAVDCGGLVAYGHSSWEITGRADCGLGGTRKDTECCAIILGVRKATPVTIDADWNSGGDHGIHSSKGVVAAIVLGMAYVFSRRLVELQGQGDDVSLSNGYVHYTESVAAVLHDDEEQGPSDSYADVYVGDVDDDASRWWQAVLAPGQGWKAVIATDERGPFLAPWATRIGNGLSFRIRQERKAVRTAGVCPPSSSRAMQFLQDFCRLHNAGTAFSIAIATVLLLPVHNLYGSPVKIQWQRLHQLHRQNGGVSLDKQLENFRNNLPYYMTLGCHPRGIMSNLCGVFWEPDIPCNLAHAWLYAPLDLLPRAPGVDGVETLYHDVLIRDCALRRPNIASLFLAASLTNLMPMVLRFVRSGLPVLDLDAAAWTGSAQSFIQNSGQRVSNSPECMSRSDIWRLLYITGEYPSPPLTPWKPFGEMDLQDVPLQARAHHGCSDHFLRYSHWSWQLADNTVLEDEGVHPEASVCKSQSVPACPRNLQLNTRSEMIPLLEETASENATRHAFQWVTVNGDGFAPSEHEIYTHEWIKTVDESASVD